MYWGSGYEDGEPIDGHKEEILYPLQSSRRLSSIPKAIEKRYQAALRVQKVEPNAFAVLMGKTLEAICNHEGVTEGNLHSKIGKLVNSERIPKTLAEMAYQLKTIRNIGAHDDKDEVTERDVPIILDFVEAILEYLYVAPAKIEVVRKRLNKDSDNSSYYV